MIATLLLAATAAATPTRWVIGVDDFAALERAIDMGWRRWYFDRDPILQPIRELPEFEELQKHYDEDIARMRELVLEDFAANGPESDGSKNSNP